MPAPMLSSVFRFQPCSPATGWQTQIRSNPAKHKKSEPIPHREEVRISYVWWGKVDSNFARKVYYNFFSLKQSILF